MKTFCVRATVFAILGFCLTANTFAEDLDYHVTDPDLKVVRLDSSPDDSFLSVRVDTEGRIFVGGRKTLYAYDVDDEGRYKPRRLLFEFPDHTWVNDIEIRGDDLYVVTVSAVYRLPEARVKRDGLTIERLLWGVPNGHVHQCFHACAWGPEGDLYVSMGDPLWYYGDFSRPDHWGHWTMFYKSDTNAQRAQGGDEASTSRGQIRIGDKDWAAMPYNGVGGVFRIRPDGTNLRSYARGLRNPCGLCFDKEWNLFTNDNDHEGIPALYAPGRLLHVTEGAYFSWPRGWLQSKTPDRADLFPAVNEEMGRAVPVLQTYYADSYLPPKYENSLMVARWCRRQVTYFPLETKGSTFIAKEHVLLEGRDQARPVGVCVGRGGRVFVTICYMAQNEGSPTYRSDLAVITRKDDPAVMPFEGRLIATIEPKRLWNELEHRSWSRRNAAHQEIARRSNLTIGKHEVTEFLESRVHPMALPELRRRLMPHLPYLSQDFRQAFASDTAGIRKQFDSRIFRHITDAISFDARSSPPADRSGRVWWLDQLLQEYWYESPSPNAFSWFRMPRTKSREERDKERWGSWTSMVSQRHLQYKSKQVSCALLGAEFATTQIIGSECRAENSSARMTGTLAAGFRLTIPPVDAKLSNEAPLTPQQKEEANIILFADEKDPIDLRKYGRVGNYTVAEHWKAVKHTEDQEQLFALLMERLDDEDDKIRLQAAHFLSLLNDPRSEPKVALVTANVQDKRLNLGKLEHLKPVIWTLGPIPDADGFKTVHPIETAAIDLSGKYGIADKQYEWKQTNPTSPDRPLYDFRMLFGPSPNSSVYSFFRFDAPTAQRMQLLLGSEDGVKVWQNGKLVFENDVVRPLIQLDDVVSMDLQPGSNDILVRVRMRQGLGGQYFHYRHLGDVKLTIPEKPDGLSLAERLKSAGSGSQAIDPKYLEVDWPTAVKEGDIARGKKLFAAESLGCAKCHAATAGQAGGGGPSLTDSGKRFTVPYLVESVLAPNKVISPVFKSSVLQLTDGRVITGLVVSETADQLEILQPDTKRIRLQKTDIEVRKIVDVSAMPVGLVKAPDELRDVIAYLLSNPAPE